MADTPRKELSAREKEFVRLMVDAGLGPIEAARQAFNWRCETGTREAQRAKDLARNIRIVEYMEEYQSKLVKQQQVAHVVKTADALDMNQLRDYALKELIKTRDDANAKSSNRLRAIKALEKLADPAADVNLIFRWMDNVWRFAKAHCPSCHKSFPLWKVKNPKLDTWRVDYDCPKQETPETDVDRRIVGFKLGDKRRVPVGGQLKCLGAPERHQIGLGAARAGKSWYMGNYAACNLMLPGVEIWILAEIYESARSEQEYLQNYLKTCLYPFYENVVKVLYDGKTGELTVLTKWGSELKIRSAKSKGSITGRALELAMVAEPGWVPEDLYEELRARISERLAKILAFGTPKGTEGFIGRMVKMTGRDPVTGKIVKRTPQERLIENGCPWNVSMIITTFSPEENPEYVKSEIDAARQELTDIEFASEFRGEMTAATGAKFAMVRSSHLHDIPETFYQNCVFVLGMDQGPTNFGACLTAYNGKEMVVCSEWYDNSTNTMSRNLKILRDEVPRWIKKLGGNVNDWIYTITDRHPPIDGIFYEMEEEGLGWPTQIGTIPVNIRKLADNWRRDTTEFVNNMASADKLAFDQQHCWEIHDDVMNTSDKPLPIKDNVTENDKGWIVNNPWRADHVMDAWLFTMYAVNCGAVLMREEDAPPSDAIHEAQAAWDYRMKVSEARELKGFLPPESIKSADQMWKESFGRGRGEGFPVGSPGFYTDES